MEGELKHTPGPWDLEPESCGILIVVDENQDEIATIIAANDDDLLTHKEWANGRLISAAPDLLKELKEMIFWFDKKDVRNPSALRAIEDAKNAITKAIGEQ